ncbi:hypothetical protein [Gramella sp. KN1008]|uniref:hypothetical protein n=1 Tax=Gramella sp. KN1008 TaxID=2529298 RepID=UPI00103A3C39|nr:hypothetical protein [Gramella sp. KN1008]TBW28904.1 hypothetical protein EZJ28_03215 [Gramella sp. KN1008]
MPKLLLKRNSEWANKMKVYELYLNGKKFTEIDHDEVLSFEIPEGKYRLVAKVDWCSSQPLDLEFKEGELRKIEITGFVFSKYLFPAAALTLILYMAIYFHFKINSLLLASILMFFFGYMIYFMSFGRGHYLRLIERP